MELFLKIAAAAAMILLLVYLWPTFKHWQEHGPRAKPGDWMAAAVPLAGVVLFVVLLVLAVR
ncbi:hypothetical protein Thimo_2329 [Thioflavicoccus mobilis 8321]|uniref:Seryl-tRNA synthetase n=1 Tax=Thioflavicoccus mobilis 8321 TaxID=765912 RepID=L0H0F6_9GAMM|nr:hypothetical protein [Thioflavicoccus mobilis]AGA91069.1 hypothetical protein Thimo_2329 [Thioflavicoccus mobilis 8321]